MLGQEKRWGTPGETLIYPCPSHSVRNLQLCFVQLRWNILDVPSNENCAFMHSLTKRMPNFSAGSKGTDPLSTTFAALHCSQMYKNDSLQRSTCIYTVLLGTLFQSTFAQQLHHILEGFFR